MKVSVTAVDLEIYPLSVPKGLQVTVSPKHTDFREKFTVERCRLHFVAAKQAGIGHAGRVNSSYVPNWPFCGRKRSSV